jgi:uncharacterized membrane protein
LRANVSTAEWDAVIVRVTEHLRAGAPGRAVVAGLDAIGSLLATKGVARGSGNAFGDAPIEEAGA